MVNGCEYQLCVFVQEGYCVDVEVCSRAVDQGLGIRKSDLPYSRIPNLLDLYELAQGSRLIYAYAPIPRFFDIPWVYGRHDTPGFNLPLH